MVLYVYPVDFLGVGARKGLWQSSALAAERRLIDIVWGPKIRLAAKNITLSSV